MIHNVYQHTAYIKWPTPQAQIDWVDQEVNLEQWLDQYIGPGNWRREVDTIAFKQARDKTLFLLAFS